jgi:glycerol-3-phosphate dehydrogenase (NAD(P)+)
MPEQVAVVGGGSWGTTIAALAARRAPTVLWARSAELAASIARRHENADYLPGVRLPDSLRVTSDLGEAVGGAGLVLMAVPSHGFRAVLIQLAPYLPVGAAVISLAKGVEEGTDRRMSEIVGQLLPAAPTGVLTGPNLAVEVAGGHPAASVVAADDEDVARRVQSVLHGVTFRVYTSTDVIGCEVAGAAKNVIAMAAGMSDGLGFGENTRAALITRGLAELTRVGVALGGRALTFGGLAGVGDLVATCTSQRSRNRAVGVQLGEGKPLEDVLGGMRMVAEGIRTAAPLVRLAAGVGVEMPIAEQIASIVDGTTSPEAALATLMNRPARGEWGDGVVDEVLA